MGRRSGPGGLLRQDDPFVYLPKVETAVDRRTISDASPVITMTPRHYARRSDDGGIAPFSRRSSSSSFPSPGSPAPSLLHPWLSLRAPQSTPHLHVQPPSPKSLNSLESPERWRRQQRLPALLAPSTPNASGNRLPYRGGKALRTPRDSDQNSDSDSQYSSDSDSDSYTSAASTPGQGHAVVGISTPPPRPSTSPTRWTPDSSSAAHPGLPPPPACAELPNAGDGGGDGGAGSPLSRARTRSNESASETAAVALNFCGGPSAKSALSASLSRCGESSPRGIHERTWESSFRSWRKGRRANDSSQFVVLGSCNGPRGNEAADGAWRPPIMPEGCVEGKVIASEDMAARMRRGWKIKVGAYALALLAVFVLLISLAVGMGVGVVEAV